MGSFRRSAASEIHYSDVGDRATAERLVQEGRLAALLMLPEHFGGDVRVENVVFVPPPVAEKKADFDRDVVEPLVRAGRPVEYQVKPEYEGDSLVPTSLTIYAFASEPYVCRLEIWVGAR